MENCPDVTKMHNTEQAATAIDHASTNAMGGATHIYMQINNHITGMAQLTPLAIPTITKLTILTPIPPREVRLGAKTCILAITF